MSRKELKSVNSFRFCIPRVMDNIDLQAILASLEQIVIAHDAYAQDIAKDKIIGQIQFIEYVLGSLRKQENKS